MKTKKEYVFKWHRNPLLITVTHILSTVIICVLLGIGFQQQIWATRLILIVSSIVVFVINFILFIYSFYFGWNRPVYFSKEKVWQKIKGQIYEWRWDEMTSCMITGGFRFPLMVEIETFSDYKKLSFSIEFLRYFTLVDFCPNEKIKTMLKKQHEEIKT